MEPTADYDAAADLAERRGCVLENPCWAECVEVALYDLTHGKEPAPRPLPPGSDQ